MPSPQYPHYRGYAEFFLISLSHEDLANYYTTNFRLMREHNFSLNEIDELIPWEKEVYVTLLMQWIKEQQEHNKGS